MSTRRRIKTGYRKYRPKGRFSFVHVLFLCILVVVALYVGIQTGTSQTHVARVVSVSDGDTITVDIDGQTQTIRLLGVDTPETHHPTKPVGCFGPEAEQFTRTQLNGKEVRLEYDVERHDKYNRTLAYVYVGDTRFNDVLIEQGYAKILSIEPNTKYEHELLVKEIEAQQKSRGLWEYCPNDN